MKAALVMAADPPLHLFGLGGQKCGTTWLFEYFRQHPQIHVPAHKEMHYFDALWLPRSKGFADRRRRRLRALGATGALGPEVALLRDLVHMHDAPTDDHGIYRDVLGRGRTSEHCLADITPSYCNLKSRHLRQLLADFAPAKFLLVLRDPVQRMWSHIRMECSDGASGATSAAADALIDRMMRGRGQVILRRSQLSAPLHRLRGLPPDRVKVMYYETLFQEAQIRALCAFLEVDYMAADCDTRVREGAALPMTKLQHATLRWLNAPEYRAIHRLEGATIPASWDMEAQMAPRPEGMGATDDDGQILQGRRT